MSDDDRRLAGQLDRDAERLERAQRERGTLLAQTVFMGSLAGIFVIPVIGGAYLGRWLDGMQPGYSVRWTLGTILLGVIVGAVNAWRYIRERG